MIWLVYYFSGGIVKSVWGFLWYYKGIYGNWLVLGGFMMYENVIYEISDYFVMLIFNCLDWLNVWIGDMEKEVWDVMVNVEVDFDVWVIILIGVGCGFCVGVEMNNLVDMSNCEDGFEECFFCVIIKFYDLWVLVDY